MGFRFHRRLTILPGVHLNLSKSGISLSVGGAPLTLNIGNGIRRLTASLPGSGLSWSKRFDEGQGRRKRPRAHRND